MVAGVVVEEVVQVSNAALVFYPKTQRPPPRSFFRGCSSHTSSIVLAVADDDGPSVPPADLDVLDAEIKLRDGGTSWQYLHSVVRAKLLPAVVNTVGSE